MDKTELEFEAEQKIEQLSNELNFDLFRFSVCGQTERMLKENGGVSINFSLKDYMFKGANNRAELREVKSLFEKNKISYKEKYYQKGTKYESISLILPLNF